MCDVQYLTELERMREFDRGRQAGLAVRDTTNWQLEQARSSVRQRLRDVDLPGGSHENMSRVCEALYGSKPIGGWTASACQDLIDKLVRLLGGHAEKPEAVTFAERIEDAVSKGEPVTLFGVDYYPVPDLYQGMLQEYDTLDNERAKVVAKLREYKNSGAARVVFYPATSMRERMTDIYAIADIDWLIHILGGDSQAKPRSGDEHAESIKGDLVDAYLDLRNAMGEAKNTFDALANKYDRMRLDADGGLKSRCDQLERQVDDLIDLIRDAARDYKGLFDDFCELMRRCLDSRGWCA